MFSKKESWNCEYGMQVGDGSVTLYLRDDDEANMNKKIDLMIDMLSEVKYDKIEVITDEKSQKVVNAWIPIKKSELNDMKKEKLNRLLDKTLAAGAYLGSIPIYNGLKEISIITGFENPDIPAIYGTIFYLGVVTAKVVTDYASSLRKNEKENLNNLEKAFENPMIEVTGYA